MPPDSWALVTSAGRMLAENRMKAANLPLPIVMVCAEDVMTGKPSPEGYIKAALALGLEPGECVVFEDASAGIKAGLASGA
ncbi:HAD-IA family hydrolase, partial [Escherichia coli]|uniref:HAD-IA family hydrolase n=1 Tax=Escherichia coli TaxID=562 RepID=UPI003F238FC0